MKVLYDHTIFEQQYIGGISRYFSEIVSNLPSEISSNIAIKYSNNLYLKRKNIVNTLPIINYRDEFIKGIEFKGKGRLFNLAMSLFPSRYPDLRQLNFQYSVELLRKNDFDIFHPTQYEPYFLKYIGKKPFVLTIHDMIHEIYPEYFSPDNYTSLVKKELAEKASHIIAVSESTKNDIIRFYGIDMNRITVIHHGINALRFNKVAVRENSKKYLLFIGAREAYKNFLFFIHATADILNQNDLNLICTGEAFNDRESELFRKLGIEKHVLHCFADDFTLADLYRNALAFISPSLYEGFGMPILEAFANDCPVALSDTSCFPEIAGDAALFFNPKDRKQIQDVITCLISNRKLRNELIFKGKERLKTFSWLKAAEKTGCVYKNVVAGDI